MRSLCPDVMFLIQIEEKRQDDAGGVFLPNRDTFSHLASALIKPRSHLVLIVSFRVPRHSLNSVRAPPRAPSSHRPY